MTNVAKSTICRHWHLHKPDEVLTFTTLKQVIRCSICSKVWQLSLNWDSDFLLVYEPDTGNEN